MRIRLTQDSLTPGLRQILGSLPQAKRRILKRVGERFAEAAKENIGHSGPDRPTRWKSLSSKYAKRVKRPYATLKVSGALQDSIHSQTPTESSVTVVADSDYAAVHQLGGGNNIPERPYFPVTASGQLTAKAEAELTAIVESEISRLLQ